MPRCLIAVLCFTMFGGCSKNSDDKAKSKSLPDAVLASIRTPKANEFDTPEAVAEFLVEQIRRRDFTESTKAFPIRERYERVGLVDQAGYLRQFTLHQTPIPGAEYHNLEWAMEPLEIYDELSIACLGFDSLKKRILDQEDLQADLDELGQRLDFAKLTTLTVESMSAAEPIAIPKEQLADRALKATKSTIVTMRLRCEETELTCELKCYRIGSNWRVVSLYGLEGLNDDGWRTKTAR